MDYFIIWKSWSPSLVREGSVDPGRHMSQQSNILSPESANVRIDIINDFEYVRAWDIRFHSISTHALPFPIFECQFISVIPLLHLNQTILIGYQIESINFHVIE